jgi:uncharacterized membrane protein YebE (DUF533 family)
MKDINNIISRLSRSGLLSRTARGSSKRSFSSIVTDTVIGTATGKKWPISSQSPPKSGALAAVGSMAWDAYQTYSQQTYGLNTSLQKANLQRAYMQGVYAQRSTQKNDDVPNHSNSAKVEFTTKAESRYIPSTSASAQSLTYSPASLSKRQFEQVIQDESYDTGQILILRAMITAANADGHIDEKERQRIYQQVDDFDLTTEDKTRLFDELRHPLSLHELVNTVPNSQTAIEIYAASLMAIDEQQPHSQDYLNNLASALLIPEQLVKAVHGKADQILN